MNSASPAATDPTNDDAIRELLTAARVIVVVGLSSKRMRPSFGVARYMQSAGYHIIPVNPNETEVLGEKAFPNLESIPKELHVDIVDVFRRSEEVPGVVESAIRVGARAVWMQEGVIHEAAASRARAAGLFVVMDRCILRDHSRLFG
jgi:predicted CoA-binding protein